MDINELLLDLFGRVTEHVHEAVDGLRPALLTKPPDDDANSIAWLVWHLTRVQDHHVAELMGEDQIWVTGDWAASFGIGADPNNTGYGHTPEQVASIRPAGGDAVIGYYQAVADRTTAFVRTITPDMLDRVVDDRWDPPVTMGVRLISVADDDIQHAGQASFVRGLLERG